MTKLEEVAGAIASKLSEHNFAAGPLYYLPLARAAVEALRVPGDASCTAALRASKPSVFLDNQLRYQDQVWTDRIDAILNEKP